MSKFNSTAKATCWSLTINNPTPEDEDNINEARLKGWRVDGQKEVGSEGTEHYQLMLKTPQVRGSSVKKQFPRAHIEIARNVQALSNYVHKEETRVSDLKNDNKFYPSPTKLMALFEVYIHDRVNAIYEQYNSTPWYELDGDQLLEVFDACIKRLIWDGYYVEAHGVNPQIRGSIKRYGRQIILRELEKRKVQEDATTQEEHSDESEGEDGASSSGS